VLLPSRVGTHASSPTTDAGEELAPPTIRGGAAASEVGPARGVHSQRRRSGNKRREKLPQWATTAIDAAPPPREHQGRLIHPLRLGNTMAAALLLETVGDVDPRHHGSRFFLRRPHVHLMGARSISSRCGS
jgi:hypothetical protein